MDLNCVASCSTRVCTPSSTARSCALVCNPMKFGGVHLPRSAVLLAAPRVHSKTACRGCRVVAAAAAAPPSNAGVLISKTEVPAFIPRDDMADQMVRWAFIQSSDNTISKFGMPFKVEEIFRQDDGRLWGANVHFLRNGETCTTIYIGFDDDVVLKHEWLGMNDLGFPVPEGNSTEIQGKHFEIRKVCDSKVDDQLRSSLKEVCKALVTTINKYYAFGSVFVDDAT